MTARPISEVRGAARLKVAFFDLDGTLVSGVETISAASISALAHLRTRGVRVALATGRPLFGAQHIADKLGIDEISLFFSGSLLMNPRTREVLHEETIEPAALTAVLAAARRRKLFIEFYTRETLYAEEKNPLSEMHSVYLKRFPEIQSLDQVAAREQIIKVVCISQTPEEERRMRAALDTVAGLSTAFSFGAAHPQVLFANITSARASRDRALDLLLEHFGVSADEIAAFGDAEADIPFLRRAKFGVAMAGSPSAVLEAAPYYTENVTEDGAAKAIEALLRTA